MKKLSKTFIAVMMIMCMTIATALTASATTGQTYDRVLVTGTVSKPQTVETFNGVPAKYVKTTSNTGTYCCAQLVKNYYKELYGVSVSNLTSGKTPIVKKGTTTYTCKTVSAPKVGDIYYQTGHWAIVRTVKKNSNGSYTVRIFEQNWKWSSNGNVYCAKARTINTSTYGKSHGVKFFRVYDKKGNPLN